MKKPGREAGLFICVGRAGGPVAPRKVRPDDWLRRNPLLTGKMADDAALIRPTCLAVRSISC